MAIEASGHDPEFRTLCHAVAQWLHEHGIAWSGTLAELASDLSNRTNEIDSTFVDSEQLFAFLETHGHALRQFGVDVELRKSSGQPRSVSLRTIPNEACIASPVDGDAVQAGANQESKVDSSNSEQASGSTNDNYGDLDALRTRMLSKSKTEPGRKSDPKLAESGRRSGITKEDGIATKYEPVDSFRPASLLVLVILIGILVVGFFVFRLIQHQKLEEVPVTTQEQQPHHAQDSTGQQRSLPEEETPPAQNVTSQGSMPIVSTAKRDAEVSKLVHEAVEQRNGASQYELGMRYTQGRGVKQDKVVGYAWIVVARFNGNRRSEAAVKTLTSQLSSIELQKVRLMLGDWYASGFGVPTDYVIAHSWFTLAEVAGSGEAKIRKKEIEARMSPTQIRDANIRTTAWLRRH